MLVELEIAWRVMTLHLVAPLVRLRRDERGEGGGNSLITLLLAVGGVAAAAGLVIAIAAVINSKSGSLEPGAPSK